MSQKKILYILGYCAAPPPSPSLPLGKRHPNHGPTRSIPCSFDRSLSPLSLLLSVLSSDPHTHFPLSICLFPSLLLLSSHLSSSSTIYLPIDPSIHLSLCHVVMSCRSVMSSCHTVVSCHYVIHISICLYKLNTTTFG